MSAIGQADGYRFASNSNQKYKAMKTIQKFKEVGALVLFISVPMLVVYIVLTSII